jgi:hypothetical protein
MDLKPFSTTHHETNTFHLLFYLLISLASIFISIQTLSAKQPTSFFPPTDSKEIKLQQKIEATWIEIEIPLSVGDDTKTPLRNKETIVLDVCDTLPKVEQERFYFHQSYKNANQTLWDPRWRVFREKWVELHPKWTFIFWTDYSNELLWNCTVKTFCFLFGDFGGKTKKFKKNKLILSSIKKFS